MSQPQMPRRRLGSLALSSLMLLSGGVSAQTGKTELLVYSALKADQIKA